MATPRQHEVAGAWKGHNGGLWSAVRVEVGTDGLGRGVVGRDPEAVGPVRDPNDLPGLLSDPTGQGQEDADRDVDIGWYDHEGLVRLMPGLSLHLRHELLAGLGPEDGEEIGAVDGEVAAGAGRGTDLLAVQAQQDLDHRLLDELQLLGLVQLLGPDRRRHGRVGRASEGSAGAVTSTLPVAGDLLNHGGLLAVVGWRDLEDPDGADAAEWQAHLLAVDVAGSDGSADDRLVAVVWPGAHGDPHAGTCSFSSSAVMWAVALEWSPPLTASTCSRTKILVLWPRKPGLWAKQTATLSCLRSSRR